MATPPKKKIPVPSSAAKIPVSIPSPEYIYATMAFLLLGALIGILLMYLLLGGTSAATWLTFLRGKMAFTEMLSTSIAMVLGGGLVLGGAAGFMLARVIPRTHLARLNFAAKIVLIVLPVLLIYIPAMTASFIWDDDQEITINLSLRSWEGLKEIWAGTKSMDYFPLKTTMIWIEYQLGGFIQVWNVPYLQRFPSGGVLNGFHIVNILLHAINAVLVWIVLRRLGIPGAWLAGLVFGIHPVHVESAAWIAERKNTLSMLFFLLSILAYLAYEEKATRKKLANVTFRFFGVTYFYLASLLFFIAGLLCKTHIVVLPLVLLVLAWWRHGFAGVQSDRSDAPGERTCMGVINAIVGLLGVVLGAFGYKNFFWGFKNLLALNAHFHAVHENVNDPIIFASHMFMKGYLEPEFWLLAALCIASGSVGLSAWLFTQKLNRHLVRGLAFFQIAVLFGALTVAFQYGRAIGGEDIPIGAAARRFANAGWAVWWYLGKALVPARLITIYPRWEITPPLWYEFIPLLILIIVMYYLWRGRDGWKRILLAVMAYFVLTLLPVMGFLKMSYMRLDTLVADHFQYISDISVIAAVCAGVVWLWKNRAPLRPLIAVVGTVLISALSLYSWDRAGIYQGEETLWRDTLSKNDATWHGHNHIGVVLFTQARQADQSARLLESQGQQIRAAAQHTAARQKLTEAMQHFGRAVELKPNNPEIHNNLGLVYSAQGRLYEGLEAYQRAVQIKGDEPSMRLNLANTLATIATRHVENANKLQTDHGSVGAAQELATAQQRFEAAAAEYRQVLKLDNQAKTNAVVHVNLGVALLQLGRIDEAEREFRRATEIDPNMPQARQSLYAVLQQKALGRLTEQLKTRFAALPAQVQSALNASLNAAVEKIRRGDIAGAQNAIASVPLDAALESARQELLAIFPQRQ